jgi:hypothetical protein
MTKVRATLPWESGLGHCRKRFPGRGVNTEISPLRFAPVEMTKGRATLPWESGFRRCRKTFPGRGANTEISPLRFAPVEMTKVRATLPWKGGLGHCRKRFPGRGVNTEISPLRFAPVEMTKGGRRLHGRVGSDTVEKHFQEGASAVLTLHSHESYGMIAVLISLERSFNRRSTVSRSDSCARPVMYSLHLKRPLASKSKALRQAAGVWWKLAFSVMSL